METSTCSPDRRQPLERVQISPAGKKKRKIALFGVLASCKQDIVALLTSGLLPELAAGILRQLYRVAGSVSFFRKRTARFGLHVVLDGEVVRVTAATAAAAADWRPTLRHLAAVQPAIVVTFLPKKCV